MKYLGITVDEDLLFVIVAILIVLFVLVLIAFVLYLALEGLYAIYEHLAEYLAKKISKK